MFRMTGKQMADIATQLGLPKFDLLLIGDGAGTLYYKPCGWCCHAFFPQTDEVLEHRGGTSGGTNNFAELMPYVHALWHYEAAHASGLITDVEIVSDSEVTVKCGNKEYTRRANASLWSAIEWFEKNGYRLHWNWVRRNSNPANHRADAVAVETRKAMEKLSLVDVPG